MTDAATGPTPTTTSGADFEALFAAVEAGQDYQPSIERHTPRQEVFLPVHEFVRLTPAELRVIDHPAFQRLRRVKQLEFTHLVYPGATHTRFEHALGTLHVAQQMLSRLATNQPAEAAALEPGSWTLDRAPSASEVVFTRLLALTHDIAHVPYGHSLEDDLGAFEPMKEEAGIPARHDNRVQVEDVLQRTVWDKIPCGSLASLIDRLYDDAAQRAGSGHTPSELLLDLITTTQSKLTEWGDLRWQVCQKLVSDTLCADLIDYLHRDRHHLGMPAYFSSRLFDYLELRRRESPINGRPTIDHRLVLALQTEGRLRGDGISELLEKLQWRHNLYEIAYLHRTKLCATAMLESAIGLYAQGGGSLSDLHSALYDHDDDGWLVVLATRSRRLQKDTCGAAALHLAELLRHRKLHKAVVDLRPAQFEAWTWIRDRLGGPANNLPRLQFARALEEDLGLPLGSVAIFCPSDVKAKLNRVEVLVDGDIRSLADHENLFQQGRASTDLTAGALGPQVARFHGLWRLVVAVDATIPIDQRRAIGDVVRALVRARDDRAAAFAAAALATRVRTSPFAKKAPDSSLVAASQRKGDRYPTGAPRLLEFLAL